MDHIQQVVERACDEFSVGDLSRDCCSLAKGIKARSKIFYAPGTQYPKASRGCLAGVQAVTSALCRMPAYSSAFLSSNSSISGEAQHECTCCECCISMLHVIHSSLALSWSCKQSSMTCRDVALSIVAGRGTKNNPKCVLLSSLVKVECSTLMHGKGTRS